MRSVEYLEYLRSKYGIRPRRRLGQHFMIDDNILEFMVKTAEVHEDDVVLEIGPGPGLLTRYLVTRAGRVVAVELDERMVEILERELGEASNLEIVQADFLKYDVPDDVNKVVANIPYNISSPITFKLLELDIDVAVLTYQQEFAERMVAEPGSKKYSRLTVMVNLLADVELLRGVPRRAFIPPPRVSSSVVRLVPKPAKERPDVDMNVLESVCRALFQHKNKIVRNALLLSAHEWATDREQARRVLKELPDDLLSERPLHLPPERVAELAAAIENALG
ncbi:16S rRNA (adenine(1518)-N(6)/adenine(1519)-N(6))-dimethyltransferase RsmA [Methanopyrus sp.]